MSHLYNLYQLVLAMMPDFSTEEIRTLLLAASLILSNSLTIIIFLKNNKNSGQDKINEKLFKIQDISIKYPYLEDSKFASKWSDFKKSHDESSYDVNDDEYEKYLRYEQYCEIIFNFIHGCLDFHGKEKKALSDIDLKSWAINHRAWWELPLEDNSNQNSYDQAFSKIINSWLKEYDLLMGNSKED